MEDEPRPMQKGETTVTVLCEECGDVVEVQNVRAMLLALHLKNVCSSRTLLFGEGGEEG